MSAAAWSARIAARAQRERHGLVDAVARARARFALGALPLLPAPFVLARRHFAPAAHAAERIVALLDRALDERRADGAWARYLTVPDALVDVVDERPAAARRAAVRVDALLDPATDRVRFIELQAGDPSGAGWSDLALGIARAHGLLDGIAPAPALIDERLDTLRALAGRERPRVAFACPDASFVRSDHDVLAALARARNLDAVRVDPRALTLSDGRVRARGRVVDVVVRDTHDELAGPGAVPGGATVIAAERAGVPLQNPLASAILDDKGSFALLFDPDFRATMTADERALVDAFVVPTALADDDARARAARAPADVVVKPRHGYGGFDVVVGRDDGAALARALDAARAPTTVIQPLIDVTREDVWFPVGGTVRCVVTLSLWLFGGRVAGGYARAGRARVVNVHQGGGLGPLVVVDE